VMESISVAPWLAQFVKRAESMLGPRFHIECRIASGHHDMTISADASLLDLTLMNIVANARDAMPAGGRLVIAAARPDERGMVEIKVEDRGAGISDANIGHIFDPLFTTKDGGRGLGLTIAYQAMKQQDGAISVESTVGAGTTFTLSFRDGQPAVAADAKHARRMLIVEDDEAVAEGLRVLLETEAFEVRVVATGAEAVPSIKQFAPDLVLLDVNLPDASGIDVLNDIRRHSPDLTVIFSTGHADGHALQELLERDAKWIMKPYDVHELLALIASVTEAE
jgi:two-component system, cell cycle sensor histidine kinase and response regulator CckA